jgi:heme/copper-type cytochrome/quinol oxidase subunit 2
MKTIRILAVVIGIALILFNLSQWMLYPPDITQTNPEDRLKFYIIYDLYFIIGLFLLIVAALITRYRNKRKRMNKFISSLPE